MRASRYTLPAKRRGLAGGHATCQTADKLKISGQENINRLDVRPCIHVLNVTSM